jgi:hypothetical protein
MRNFTELSARLTLTAFSEKNWVFCPSLSMRAGWKSRVSAAAFWGCMGGAATGCGEALA